MTRSVLVLRRVELLVAALLVAALILLAAPAGLGQSLGPAGAECTPHGVPTFNGSKALSARVFALAAIEGSGDRPKLFAGGAFTGAGGLTAEHIAAWDGSSWATLGSGTNGTIYGLAVLDALPGLGPELYVGGEFTSANGIAASHIARWDGTGWSPLGLGVDAPVWDFALYDDGTGGGPALHAAGDFTHAGLLSARYIAKWDGSDWSALGSGLGNWVECLAVFDEGQGGGPALFAGGSFLSAGGQSVHYIARWDGSVWSHVGGGVAGPLFKVPAQVLALKVFDDGSGPALYAGGKFAFAGGQPADGVARWDGTSWSALGDGIQGIVRALEVFDDGSGPALYAGGDFFSIGDVGVQHMARWDGASWSAGGSGTGDAVWALAAFDDGGGPSLFAGGEFVGAFETPDAYLAKWAGCPPSPWTDLGFALAGSGGLPKLAGTGPLTLGSRGTLTLSDAAPSAPALLLVAPDSQPAPFKCGTLAPVPVLVDFLFATSPTGGLGLSWSSWPPGAAGFSLYFQYAIVDAGAACGVALSNALRAAVP